MTQPGPQQQAGRGGQTQFWSPAQRGVLIGLLGVMLVYLAIAAYRNPRYVSDPQPRVPARALELEDRIDPNRAEWHTLAAMPMIGERRARDIVAYREDFLARNPTTRAFQRPADLLNIRGIGPATVSQIEPYLIFNSARPQTLPPTTQP